MNMIVNKSDLVGYEAVDRTEAKKKALAKIVAAWESKQAKSATRFGGLGFLAVSLAACNSSSDDTAATTTTTTTTTTTAVTVHTATLATTADVITADFTTGDDVITASDTTFGAGDVLVDSTTTDTDTINVTMAGTAAAAPATVTGVEVINYNYASNITANETTVDLANIIGAHATINHSGNALVAPNATTVTNVGPNMTVTLGQNLDTTAVNAVAGNETNITTIASATGVTINAGQSAVTITTGASSSGTTINGGTGGAMVVNLGATNSNTTITAGTGTASGVDTNAETNVTIDNNSATGSTISTGYAGTLNQVVTVNNIASATSLTVAKVGTATSTMSITLDGTAATTDTATVTASGIVALETSGAQQVEVLTLQTNGAAATFNLNAVADQPLSTTFAGDQSITMSMLQAQAVGHTTGIIDSTTAGTTTVQITDAGDTGDYSKIAADVIEFQVDTTGTNVLTMKDGATISFTTEADHNTAFTVDVSDGATTHTSAGTLTMNVTTPMTGVVTVDATASSDNIATLNVALTSAQAALDIRGGTATTVKLTGAVTATVAATTTAAALDASGMTAAVTATQSNTNKSITTGSGDDTINGIAAPAASSTVNGGDGNDIFVVANASANANTTLSNIEVLNVSAAEGKVTFNASQLSGKSYIIQGDNAADIIDIDGAAGTGTAIDVSTIDLSTLTFSGGAATTKMEVNVSGFDPAKFLNTQSFNITGSANIDDITASANGDTISGGASADIITGGAGADTLSGDAGIDTIVGGAGADTINGGAAADIITGGLGADIITGGAGVDIINVSIAAADASAGTAAAAASTTGFDTITDFAVGTNSDTIDVGAASSIAANAGATTTAGTGKITSGVVTFNAADDTLAEKIVAAEAAMANAAAGEGVMFQHGSDAYVLVSDGADNLGVNDALLKLTGIDTTSTTSDVLSAGAGGIFTIA